MTPRQLLVVVLYSLPLLARPPGLLAARPGARRPQQRHVGKAQHGSRGRHRSVGPSSQGQPPPPRSFAGCLPAPPPPTPRRQPTPSSSRACARKDPLGDFSLLLLHPEGPQRWNRAIRDVKAHSREVIAWLPPPSTFAEADLQGQQADVSEVWGHVLQGSGHLRIQQVGGSRLTAMQTILRAAETASGDILLIGWGEHSSWLQPQPVSEALHTLRLSPLLAFVPIGCQTGGAEGDGLAVRRSALASLSPLGHCLQCQGDNRTAEEGAAAVALALAAVPELLRATGWQVAQAEVECWWNTNPGPAASLCLPGEAGQLCPSRDRGSGACLAAQRRTKWGIIVQYFQQPANLERLTKGLAATVRGSVSDAEIVVMNDSSSELRHWAVHLGEAAKHEGRIRLALLVASNNLHEIRAYNYASRLAQTELLALLQDDDDPSGDPTWLSSAAGLMSSHPQMALLGGHRGRLDCSQGGDDAPMDNKRHQADGLKFGLGHLPIPTLDAETSQPFMFAYKVNAAPLVVRRDTLLSLGGLHTALSCPGEAGIVFDFELSVRMWAEGHQVGLFQSGFIRLAHSASAWDGGATADGGVDVGGAVLLSGTRKNKAAHKVRIANYHRNNMELYRMYPDLHHRVGTEQALQLTRALPRSNSMSAGDWVL